MTPKPVPIAYTFEKIPAYFTKRDQWVCWQYTWKVSAAPHGHGH